MGNTKEGARKAVETMRKRYGDDWLKMRAKKAGEASGQVHSVSRFKKGSKRARQAGLKGAASRYGKQN